MPPEDRSHLRTAGAAALRARARPPDALSHPDRRAAEHAAGHRCGSGRTMRTVAAVLPRIGAALEVGDVGLEGPRDGEALVRLEASGVCHSDLNAADGTAETPCPAVLGHEGAGVVEAVGPDVTRVAPGDHVALSWMP